MKLYDCTQAPNPRRVRIFAAEKGIELEKIEINIVAGENLTDEYLAVNPRGTVPTLVLDDGKAIDEVPAICTYLEGLDPEPPLMGTTPLERAEIVSWERHMELDGMAAAGEVLRNSAPFFAGRGLPGRKGDDQIPALVERGKRGMELFYERLEQRLAKTSFVGGAGYSFADVTGLCVVDFAKFVGFAIPDGNEHTKRWYAEVSSRPSARA